MTLITLTAFSHSRKRFGCPSYVSTETASTNQLQMLPMSARTPSSDISKIRIWMSTSTRAFRAAWLKVSSHSFISSISAHSRRLFWGSFVACPYNFSEAFGSIAQSHKHVRTHQPAVLANMQYAKDTPNTIPGSSLMPVPEKVPEYLIIDPPVRNGPKAPPEALIHALADTQDSWDSQADMTFRTAFGFVPVSHSEAALEGAPIPPYDMYAQGTPSDTRSLFNPVPEYTLCTPRHPASHKSWKRLPVKMQLGPKRRHEKIATPWCNLSDLSRRDDEKINLIMSRDPEKAIQQQKKKGPRKVALEDPEEVPEGLEREWPTRETIGPWHYLEDMS
jgi:hypothetical protein